MPNRPLPLPPPHLFTLHRAPPRRRATPLVPSPRHRRERPHGLDHLVLALPRKEARDARDELVDAVRVLHHDPRVRDGERHGDRPRVPHPRDERADLAFEPCEVSASQPSPTPLLPGDKIKSKKKDVQSPSKFTTPLSSTNCFTPAPSATNLPAHASNQPPPSPSSTSGVVAILVPPLYAISPAPTHLK